MPVIARVKPDSPFRDILGERVPLVTFLPIIPREEGCPRCYLINGPELTSEQIEQMAQRLLEQWSPECETLDQAREALLDPTGFPLRCDHFTGVSVTGKELGLLM